MAYHYVAMHDPAGEAHWLGRQGPTRNASEAIRFTNPTAAQRAALAAVWGDPNAFWESERRSAALTRQRMRGWTAEAREAQD